MYSQTLFHVCPNLNVESLVCLSNYWVISLFQVDVADLYQLKLIALVQYDDTLNRLGELPNASSWQGIFTGNMSIVKYLFYNLC